VVRLGVGHLSIAVGEKEVVAEIVQSLLCFDDPLEPFLCSALQLALGCLADQVGLRQFQVDRILLATFRKLDSLSSEIVSSGILGMLSQIDVAPSPAIAREMLELASRNSDWRVRMEAMRLVGRMPSISDELVELLENVLKQEKDIDVSGYAAFCLWRKGIKTKDIFEKALYSEWSAYGTQSSDLSIEEPMDYLIELIQDPDVMVGWCVVDKIKKTNNREGFLSTLLENLQKPNLLARARSAEILLSWGHEDVIEILLGMLGEQDPNVNSSVMQVLTEYSANEKVVRSIRCRINSQEPLVRLRLAELLCDFGMKDEAAPVLSGLFEGGDAGFVLSVAEVLVQLDMAEPVIPVLLELSKIATGSECLRIARVLVSAGGFEASVPIFIEFIGTAKLHSATQQLLMALSILEGAESSAVLIPVLRELLDDASYAVSSRAAAVLNAWGSFDSFLPLMIEEVRNPRFQKRSQWISVFGMWNPRKDTHSVLIELLQDPEKGIQFAAAQVLVRWSVNYQLASPALVDWIVKELMPGSGDELRDAFGASQRLNSSFLKPEVRTQAGILLSVLPDDTKWKKQLRELSLNLVWRHCATTG
jgi:HEAT repeat protein